MSYFNTTWISSKCRSHFALYSRPLVQSCFSTAPFDQPSLSSFLRGPVTIRDKNSIMVNLFHHWNWPFRFIVHAFSSLLSAWEDILKSWYYNDAQALSFLKRNKRLAWKSFSLQNPLLMSHYDLHIFTYFICKISLAYSVSFESSEVAKNIRQNREKVAENYKRNALY